MLAYILNSNKVRMEEKKMEAIREWSTPSWKKDL